MNKVDGQNYAINGKRRTTVNTPIRLPFLFLCLFLGAVGACPVSAQEVSLPDGKVLMQALEDELTRSMQLQMKDLGKPYFVQYTVDDVVTYRLIAKLGAIVVSTSSRSRPVGTQVRVGTYKLDNTNFSGGGGSGRGFGRRGRGGGGRGGPSLPLEADYKAIRQALWWATDGAYKAAVETFTQKKAYLAEVNLENRPDDFSKVPAVSHVDPSVKLVFDKKAWEAKLRKLSGRFCRLPRVQDSNVRLVVTAGNGYLVNSEGTRLRTGNTRVQLSIGATVQGKDGMRVTDSLSYSALTPANLPPVDRILDDIDTLASKLTAAVDAPYLTSYTGPVLLEGEVAAGLFRSMLARGLAGTTEPVGTRRSRFRSRDNLEKKLGQRILPRSFRVYDDPAVESVAEIPLFGHYEFDDEGVKARRVDLVEKGRLKNMLLSRVPTRSLTGSTGHGRRMRGGGRTRAAIGSLFIESDDGKTPEELKAALIEVAREDGLDFGIRVASIRSAASSPGGRNMRSMLRNMRRSGGAGEQTLGDPVFIYKVYVKDGREEMVRGCEFAPVKLRDLRDIIAAGKVPTVDNNMGSSIVAPAVIFEELELMKIEQELPRRPVLENPLLREKSK